jgi:hypothetical protein
MPTENTKTCENCDAVIAKDEKICPACKIDLENLEASLTELERLEKIRDKRKKKTTPPVPETTPQRKGLFGRLIK